jgi:hypothetical protein
MLLAPESVSLTARDCSISVNPDTIRHLREAYGGDNARQRAFSFVTPEFQAEADDIYVELGRPEISLETGWNVFKGIVHGIESRRSASVSRS